jgi:hypothetical protein
MGRRSARPPEKSEAVVVHEEVLNETTEVLENRHGDRNLAVGRCRQPKKRI